MAKKNGRIKLPYLMNDCQVERAVYVVGTRQRLIINKEIIVYDTSFSSIFLIILKSLLYRILIISLI